MNRSEAIALSALLVVITYESAESVATSPNLKGMLAVNCSIYVAVSPIFY